MRLSPARLRREGGYMLLAIMLMIGDHDHAATRRRSCRGAADEARPRRRDDPPRHAVRGAPSRRSTRRMAAIPPAWTISTRGRSSIFGQRYKDPLAKDGKWKLLNYGDIAMLLNGAGPGTPAASMGTLGGSHTTPGSALSNSASPVGFGSQSAFQPQQQQQSQPSGGFNGGYPSNSDVGGNGEGVGGRHLRG